MTLARRAVINAIFYVVRTGCQWDNLARSNPHPKNVYYHYRKWCRDGTWARINRALVYLERQHQQRLPHPSGGVIDSQSTKTTECGVNAVMTAARKSMDANGIFSPIPLGIC